MWYAGVDLGWKSCVIALVSDDGLKVSPKWFSTQNPSGIIKFLWRYKAFRVVIEATGTYRWIYELLIKHGEVILAHPYRLRAIWSGRAKTDKLDAKSGTNKAIFLDSYRLYRKSRCAGKTRPGHL
jgi:transposase